RCGGKSKERATVMLLGDSSGVKYPPFLVFKSKPSTVLKRREANTRLRHGFGVAVWKEVGPAQEREGVQVHGNTKEFLRYHFGARPQPEKPVLLLWDDFSGHWSKEVIQCANELKVELLKVPPGATSVCQPADATWNGPLKARLRLLWIEHLKAQLLDRDPAVAFKLKPPTRAEICNWVSSAWKAMPASIISGGYRKCHLEVVPELRPEVAEEVVDELISLGCIDTRVGEIRPDRDFDVVEVQEGDSDEELLECSV
ncbi:hypothetical protein PR001_g23449, partial [Phytophthora rubi]